MKLNKHKRLTKVINVEKNFYCRPYAFTSRRVAEVELYVGLEERTVQISYDMVPMDILT